MIKKETVKILIVDDRKENLHSLENLLQKEEFHLFATTSGSEALKIAIKEDINLILLDVQMPGIDGYEVAGLLKKNRKTQNIPIIFITAIHREIEHIVKGFEKGAVDYIFKPVVPEILKAKVSVFIDLYKKEKELAEKNNLLSSRNKALIAAQKDLKKLNELLEEKVEKRTMQLAERNIELERINEVLDNFLHVAAHDLRGPLSNLSMSVNLFNSIDDMSQREKLVEGIDVSIKRIDQTIRGIVEMVEVQESKKNAASLVKLEELFEKIKQDYHSQIQNDGTSFHTDFSGAPEILYIAPFVESILRNLISNSIKYKSEKRNPEIEISSTRHNNHIQLKIKDNGIGIDLKRYKNTLFEPFTRIKNNNVEGTGIGLHLVKSMVEMNGGKIEVQSTPDVGTTFDLFLKPY